jgi:transcriptional regulator with XRE-family HTH domain
MGTRAIELGQTGQTFATNVALYRGKRGLRLAGLSERMTAVGRPMSTTTLSAIENATRRADVDDLVAIAAALNVSPIALLMPQANEDEFGPVETTARLVGSADPDPEAGQLWDWLKGESPLDASQVLDERDEVAIEMWRREQTPPWDHRSRTVDRG